MKAEDIMIKDVYKVTETDTIRAVVSKFIKHNISGLPIVNNNNQIVAFISDGDIMSYIGKHDGIVIDMFFLVSYIQGDHNSFEDRIKEVLDVNVMRLATKKVIKVQYNESVENIASMLAKRQIKKLPVEKNSQLVGVISRGDVIRQSFKEFLEDEH